MDIQFFTEDTTFNLDSIKQYKNWLEEILIEYKIYNAEITYIFCSDEYLLKINQEHLDHDTYTDIITFDLRDSPDQEEMMGDIFISVDRIEDNCVEHNTIFKNELARVMIHGILHLLGYNDKTEDERKVMRAEEDKAIEKLYT